MITRKGTYCWSETTRLPRFAEKSPFEKYAISVDAPGRLSTDRLRQVLQGIKSKERAELTPVGLRKKAAEFARNTVDTQSDSFRRYGVWGDFERPYLTLQPEYEAAQIEVRVLFPCATTGSGEGWKRGRAGWGLSTPALYISASASLAMDR